MPNTRLVLYVMVFSLVALICDRQLCGQNQSAIHSASDQAHTQFQLTEKQTDQKSNADLKDQTFAGKFWDYLLSNNYKHWSPAPGKPAELFENVALASTNSTTLASPHGALSKLYINRTATSNSKALPIGSVLILENYRSDRSLKSVSVMYRTSGFNPSANDWFWANYNADGSVTDQKELIQKTIGGQQTFASANSPKLAGRTTSCIRCHQSGGGDLVFFNNPTRRTANPASVTSNFSRKP